MRPGASVGYVRATRPSLPRWVRTGGTGRLAPRAPRIVRTGYAYQRRAYRATAYRSTPWPRPYRRGATSAVPYVPATVTAYGGTAGGGELDRRETRRALKELGIDPDSKLVQRQIKKFDDDGSGTLDLEEFEASVRVRVRVRARVRVRIRVRVRLGLELGSGSGLANHDSKPNPNPNQAFVDSILSADEDPAAVSWLGLGLG